MSEIKQFFVTQEDNRAVYTAVIIYHPAFGEFRLVKDYIGDIVFNVDGINKIFMGSVVQVPEESILASDDVDKGKLSFDRVGYDVMSEVRKIDDYPTLVAAEVRVLTYLEGLTAPQNDYSVFVENFNFSERKVTLDLTTRNLSKSTKNNEIFDPDEFVGLRNV